MFAMIIVSTMALNANRFIQINNQTLIEGQLESQVVAYAQDIIEESRALAFDEETTYDNQGNSIVPVNIPTGFSFLGPDAGETDRTQYNDFDDYNGHEETVTINTVDYFVDVVVEYVETNDYETYTVAAGKSTLKRITVNIESNFLKKNIGGANTAYNFSFIRSYYAD